MDITLANGSKGTATIEQGKHGGPVLVIRRGYPVAAEIVAGFKAEQASETLVGLYVSADDLAAVLGLVG